MFHCWCDCKLFVLCFNTSFTEVIKSRVLEKNELRPLYMDFQATTPMV